MHFITAIADIRSFLYLSAGLPFKTGVDIVTFMVGAVKCIIDEEFVVDIGLFTMVAMDAEVVGIVKTASVSGIYNEVFSDRIEDGRRCFAERVGYFLEGY